MNNTEALKQLSNIIFFDIETVPLTEHLDQLPEALQSLWLSKFETIRQRKGDSFDCTISDDQNYFDHAGIYSEFGRVVCISVGIFAFEGDRLTLRLKSFASDDERQILTEFADILNSCSRRTTVQLCGHNIKEFDVPFVCRRMLINDVAIPTVINVAGKKPWEVPFIDTLEQWRFGDYKSYTSLKLLATILGIPTPKDDIDGSQVATVYYRELNLARISQYCQKDVLATARLYQKFNRLPLVADEDVVFVN